MKIFKLKYFALSLLATVIISCSKDDVIKEADKEAITESNSFVFEEGINNYIVDGKLTYDRSVIASKAKKAWNVHYDYPHNKVVISTTPEEFEMYKKTNFEYRTALEESNIEAATSQRATAIAGGLPNHKKDLVFYYKLYEDKLYHFDVRPVANVDSRISYAVLALKGDTSVRKVDFDNLDLVFLTRNNDDSIQTFLKNNHTSSKTVTFYNYNGYRGSSKSITLAAGSYKRFYREDFKIVEGIPQSYK